MNGNLVHFSEIGDPGGSGNGGMTCKYFVDRKKRFCKMLTSRGQRFCGQHLVYDINCKTLVGHRRILCPLDPKHSCFEHKLKKHLLCCNAKKMDAPYFSEGINEGDGDDTLSPFLLRDLPNSELQNIITKIEKIYNDHIGSIDERIGHHVAVEKEVQRPEFGPSATRHLKQNSSILAYLRDQNLLIPRAPTVFVEFGAGRGKLTRWLIEAMEFSKNASFLLVDKGAQRYKEDAKLKYRDDLKLNRIRIDIRHLDLSRVDFIEKNLCIIACGKHLCGDATDFSLRCLALCGEEKQVSCVVIALCCHHRCTWKAYTGKEFFEVVGLNTRDFELLSSISSWAVSGSKEAKDEKQEQHSHSTAETEHPPEKNNVQSSESRYERMGLSVQCREAIGRKAKQIIDMGRVWYLRNVLKLDSKLIQYVDQKSTLENIAIVAIKK